MNVGDRVWSLGICQVPFWLSISSIIIFQPYYTKFININKCHIFERKKILKSKRWFISQKLYYSLAIGQILSIIIGWKCLWLWVITAVNRGIAQGPFCLELELVKLNPGISWYNFRTIFEIGGFITWLMSWFLVFWGFYHLKSNLNHCMLIINPFSQR